ncbi:hypothetical protein ACFL96_05430, partial [Thermoproteota archaeon]
MKRGVIVGVCLVCLLALTGCDEEQRQAYLKMRITQAEQAMERAKNAGAPEWAPGTYQKALSKYNYGKKCLSKKD